MQPVTHCSSLMEVLPKEMKPLMSCDSGGGAVTRTKAPLPLRELWFASEDDRESLWAPESPRRRRQESTYFTLQFISGGEWTGIWQQTKTHQSIAIRWLQDTHTHTHSHLVAADNKSLLALLFSFQSRRDLKAAKRLRRLKLFTSHFLPTLCSSRRRCVPYTAEQSPPGSTAPLAKL